MTFLLGLIILFGLSALSFWRLNPVCFLSTAGVAMMVGLYTPDALTELGYDTYGIGIGLMLILFSFVCIGFAFVTLFRRTGSTAE
jgi:hypothetical protein